MSTLAPMYADGTIPPCYPLSMVEQVSTYAQVPNHNQIFKVANFPNTAPQMQDSTQMFNLSKNKNDRPTSTYDQNIPDLLTKSEPAPVATEMAFYNEMSTLDEIPFSDQTSQFDATPTPGVMSHFGGQTTAGALATDNWMTAFGSTFNDDVSHRDIGLPSAYTEMSSHHPNFASVPIQSIASDKLAISSLPFESINPSSYSWSQPDYTSSATSHFVTGPPDRL